MDQLTIGQSISIRRTDGRVHSAMISKIHKPSKSVTVEWFERGETKGKEVELSNIVELNPDVLENTTAPVPKKQATASANLSRESSDSSIIEEDAFIDDGVNDIITQEMVGSSVSAGTLSVRTTTLTSSRSNHTQADIPRSSNIPSASNSIPTLATGNRTTRTSIVPPTVSTQSTNSASNGISGSDNNTTAVPTAPKNRILQATKMSYAANNATGPQASRRSYVVKEVERLKENREKRRARQAEIKEEKTALMNQDPGNPNWELSAMIREYQSQIDFRPITDGQPVEDHRITVCVRKRPLSRKEITRKEIDVISVPNKNQLIVHEPKAKVDLTKFLENHKFRFDYSFDDSCSNELVYRYTAKPLVQTIFEGGMATCFAYGQTGSGKTHTMGGEFTGKTQDCKKGLYAMAAKDVFAYLNSPRYNNLNLVVSASFFEIYSGKVFDLLSDKHKLKVLEDGRQQVQIVGLTEKVLDSVEDVLRVIQRGNNTRTSGQTSANSNSSRSHAVFQILLRPAGSSKIHGKFSFIDLAGNERGADTSSADRQTRMEGAEINKSLLALKECIRALGRQTGSYLPFRGSILTQVLRDSFIGEKSKTCMMAMISPGLSSCEHTLNTLRYANRVKELVVTDSDDVNVVEDELMEGEEIKNDVNENGNGILRSLSENDMSVEALNQQDAISEYQKAEEFAVDQHKTLIEYLTQCLPELKELYEKTNRVNYDPDAYCKRSEEIVSQLSNITTTFEQLLGEFRSKLQEEEMLSHNFKPDKR